MKLYTNEQHAKLVHNGLPENRDQDHAPVVKWFTPDASATWLVSEIVDAETAFGLCDLGQGFPELGYINIEDITGYISPNGNGIERDIHFVGSYPMSVYADAARSVNEITENDELLKRSQQKLMKLKIQ